MTAPELEAAWFGELTTTDGFPAGVLADSCGLLDIPVTRVENQCATGNDALRNALYAVGSGYVDVALVVGADKTREIAAAATFWDWMGMARDMAWDYPLGLIAPASFALHVARYMHEYGATKEHLATRRGQEPSQRGAESDGAPALRGHGRAGARGAARRRSRSACSTAPRRATAPRRS